MRLKCQILHHDSPHENHDWQNGQEVDGSKPLHLFGKLNSLEPKALDQIQRPWEHNKLFAEIICMESDHDLDCNNTLQTWHCWTNI